MAKTTKNRNKSPPALEAGDKAILRELLRNGRATNAELAAVANISESACFRRLKKMEDGGVIENYTVRLNPAAIGLNLTAVIFIGLANQSDDEVMKFEKAVARIPEVLECHLLTGTPSRIWKGWNGCTRPPCGACRAYPAFPRTWSYGRS
jgi:Lrp/AsnC family leucine-responsive transcriptional regulator